MKFKGNYNSAETYDVGDVVIFSDSMDTVYALQSPCPAGSPPTNSLYWGRVGQPMAQVILFIRDALDMANDASAAVGAEAGATAAQTALGEYFFDEKTLLLMSSTAASDKKYALTVEDGDSGGELVIDEIEEEGGDT